MCVCRVDELYAFFIQWSPAADEEGFVVVNNNTPVHMTESSQLLRTANISRDWEVHYYHCDEHVCLSVCLSVRPSVNDSTPAHMSGCSQLLHSSNISRDSEVLHLFVQIHAFRHLMVSNIQTL